MNANDTIHIAGGRSGNTTLLNYLPARIRPHVKEAYRDGDGIWIHGDERFVGPCGYHSLHCYNIAELRDEARCVEILPEE